MVASWVGLGSVFGVVGGELIDLMVLVNWSGIRIDHFWIDCFHKEIQILRIRTRVTRTFKDGL